MSTQVTEAAPARAQQQPSVPGQPHQESSSLPDDGLLDLCLVGDVGRLALLRAFPKVRTGAHLDHPAVTVLRVAELSLEMLDGDPTVRADGEPFGALPATFRVRAGALLVAGASTAPPGRA